MAEDIRVTRAGAYAELSPNDAVRVTRAGAYAEIRQYNDDIEVTFAGAYAELYVAFGAGCPVQLCGAQMPIDLCDCRYVFNHPQVLGKSGGRTPVFDRFSDCEFQWRSVTQLEWEWMTQTVLGGAQSRRCTGGLTHVYNREMNIKAWENAVVHYPQSDIRNGQHENVRLRVTHLEGESDP